MTLKKKIRYKCEACLLYIFFGFFSMLPVSWASNTGGFIFRSIGPHLAGSRKAMRNINNIFPELDQENQKKIFYGMWDNLGRVFAEYPHLEVISSTRTNVINNKFLEEAKTTGKPLIFIGAHMANWEVMGPAIALQNNLEALMVYRPPNNPAARKMLAKARRITSRLSYTTKSARGAREMVRQLKDGENLALLFDQKYNPGIDIPFFGKAAMTSATFAELAVKYDALIIPFQIVRKANVTFDIIIHNPINAQHKPVEYILKESHSLLEAWIREHPEQWLWLHKRWKDF